MPRHVRIISLGAIVTPNITKTIDAYTSIITRKSHSNPLEIKQKLFALLTHSKSFIEEFKLGKVNESVFTDRMINLIKEATGVTLTTEEFDQAWEAMQPPFAEFAHHLKEAIDYHNDQNNVVYFVSLTNPKDIRSLVEKLKNNFIPHTLHNNILREINGISLYSSYENGFGKQDLIASVVGMYQGLARFAGLFAHKIDDFDIKYVYTSTDQDKSTSGLGALAQTLNVETILWDKNKNRLVEAFESQQARLLPVAGL